MYCHVHHSSRAQIQMLCSIKSDLWHVSRFCYKNIEFHVGAEGHLPTLKEVFPVKQENVSIPYLQQNKYYKQQPVKII